MAYDLCMLLIVISVAVRGAAKGMAWQLAAIASMLLCFLFATPLSATLAPSIAVEPPLNRWIAMLGAYLVFSFICFGAARMVRGWLESVKFEGYDKHLGAVFGLIKGATLCFVITFFAVCLSERASAYILPTVSGRLSALIMRKVDRVLPADIETVLRQYEERLETAGAIAGVTGDDPAAATEGQDGQDGFLPPVENDPNFRGGSHNTTDGGPGGKKPGLLELVEEIPEILGKEIEEGVSEAKEFVAGGLDAVNHRPHNGANPHQSGGPATATEMELPPLNDTDAEEELSPNVAAESVQPQVTSKDIERRIREISLLYSGGPRDQAAHRTEISNLLEALPLEIADAALRDWLSDLLGRDPDPDLHTDAATPLDVRLFRQLGRAGLEFNELPTAVQTRLRSSEVR